MNLRRARMRRKYSSSIRAALSSPAQKESVDAILEMAEHKKFGAAKKLIVAGCLVERFRDQILEQVPEVDAVVGTGEVERILEAVDGDLRVLPAAPPAFLVS